MYSVNQLLFVTTLFSDVQEITWFGYILDVICFEQEVDLKYNGRNITVTEANKIEYIHLMADYKINKQVCLNHSIW